MDYFKGPAAVACQGLSTFLFSGLQFFGVRVKIGSSILANTIVINLMRNCTGQLLNIFKAVYSM